MKIAMYDLEGHLLEVFEGDTYQDIIDLLPVKSGVKTPSSIQKVVKGERNFAGIYQFREVRVGMVKPLDKIGSCIRLKITTEKPVHMYYKNVHITKYRTIQEGAGEGEG